MGRTLIERRLRDVSERMKQVGRELSVVDEQLAHLVDDADEARLRALVSETPLAGQDHREAQRHADAMRRHRDALVAELAELDHTQNDLLDRLVATYGVGPNYIVVRNHGRGTDFSQLDASNALKKAQALGGYVIDLAQLHEGSMRKIDRQNASFWSAIHTTSGPDALGMLERQRVKTWLKGAYATFGTLPMG